MRHKVVIVFLLLFLVIMANKYNDCDVGDIFILLHSSSTSFTNIRTVKITNSKLFLVIFVQINYLETVIRFKIEQCKKLRWLKMILNLALSFNHSNKSQLFLSQFSRRKLMSFCTPSLVSFCPITTHQAMLKQLLLSVFSDNFLAYSVNSGLSKDKK